VFFPAKKVLCTFAISAVAKSFAMTINVTDIISVLQQQLLLLQKMNFRQQLKSFVTPVFI
jgi:hypothetical protein